MKLPLPILILKALWDADGNLVPEDTLRSYVRLRSPSGQVPTDDVVTLTLTELVKERHATCVENRDTGNKYGLTDDGVARLQKANLA